MPYQIISSNTTWAAGSEHDLVSDVQVAAGATLTIDPGAIIKGQGHSIQVFGTLDAAGTSGNPVQFEQVSIENVGSNSAPSRIAIDHATIIGGGFLKPTGNAVYGSFSVTNSYLSGLPPIYVWYPTSTSTFQNDIFDHTGGISIGTSSVQVQVDRNTFIGVNTNLNSSATIEDWAAYGGVTSTVTNNNFFDNGKYLLELPPTYNGANLSASGNYFGTSNLGSVPSLIYDKNTDLTSAAVISNTSIQTQPVFSDPILGPVSINLAKLTIAGPEGSIAIPKGALITGSLQGDTILAGTGEGNWSIDGGAGHDRVDMSSVNFRAAQVSKASGGDLNVSVTGTALDLKNVEELDFLDGEMQYDPASQAAQVERLYQAALGRAADAPGLGNWVEALQSGTPLTSIAEGFLRSAEFQSRFPGVRQGNTSFVTQLYQNVLHRAPDPAGLSNWTTALNSGTQSQAQVLIGFSESPENVANLTSQITAGVWVPNEQAAQVARLYYSAFGRAPDIAGLSGWTSALMNGSLTLLQEAADFVASPEFQAKGNLTNQAYVDLLYHNVLGRSADAAGESQWTQTLNSGAQSRASVLLGFSESNEHIIKMTPVIESGGIRFS